MSSDLAEDALKAVAEIDAVRDSVVAALVDHVEAETGEVLLVRRPGVLDATMPDLIRMERQAVAYADAMRLVRQWMLQNDRRTLGAVLKVAPPKVAAEIEENLIRAGLLPSD